mgnify:CR=1 FL=1
MTNPHFAQPSRAVILLSGGLDSATALAIARQSGHECYCLSLEYGQRHHTELEAAKRVASNLGAKEHRILTLDLAAFGGSALTDSRIAVPVEGVQSGIPVTYVPARNTIMLSLALAWAEVLGSRDIYVGVNAVDYSGYPDCRPEFIEKFQSLANFATTATAVEGKKITIETPLQQLDKKEIVKLGVKLGAPLQFTHSCYKGGEKACGVCDSCKLRLRGFAEAGVEDPVEYETREI